MSLADTCVAYDNLLCEHGIEDERAWSTKRKRMKIEITNRIANVEFADSHHKNDSHKFFLSNFLSTIVEEVVQKS